MMHRVVSSFELERPRPPRRNGITQYKRKLDRLDAPILRNIGQLIKVTLFPGRTPLLRQKSAEDWRHASRQFVA